MSFLCHHHRRLSTLTCKIPLLYKPKILCSSDSNDAVPTTHLLSWGRGAFDQLCCGVEELRLYPAPVAALAALTPPEAMPATPWRSRSPVGCTTLCWWLEGSSGCGRRATEGDSGSGTRTRCSSRLSTPTLTLFRASLWEVFTPSLSPPKANSSPVFSIKFENFGGLGDDCRCEWLYGYDVSNWRWWWLRREPREVEEAPAAEEEDEDCWDLMPKKVGIETAERETRLEETLERGERRLWPGGLGIGLGTLRKLFSVVEAFFFFLRSVWLKPQ